MREIAKKRWFRLTWLSGSIPLSSVIEEIEIGVEKERYDRFVSH
jgi:hypothetical protein